MYYVVGVGNHNDTLLKYRLDRMQELELTDEDRRKQKSLYRDGEIYHLSPFDLIWNNDKLLPINPLFCLAVTGRFHTSR